MMINVFIVVVGLISLATLGNGILTLFNPGRQVSLRDLNNISERLAKKRPSSDRAIDDHANKLREAMRSSLLSQLLWRIRRKALLVAIPSAAVACGSVMLVLHRFGIVPLEFLAGTL